MKLPEIFQQTASRDFSTTSLHTPGGGLVLWGKGSEAPPGRLFACEIRVAGLGARAARAARAEPDLIKPGFYLVIDAHCRVLSPPTKSIVTFPFKFTPHIALRAPGPATPADQRDELATAAHSITSSARASSVGGTSRPSARAVLRLMTSSYFVGCCTGKFAVFVPRRMRST
jgi:hypothetical protein